MRLLSPFAILTLAACTNPAQQAPSTNEPAPVEPAAAFNCAAESVQYAIGQKTSAELGSQLIKESGSRTLRWMPPRSAATMDYRQDRLNIAYDDDMVITRINCG